MVFVAELQYVSCEARTRILIYTYYLNELDSGLPITVAARNKAWTGGMDVYVRLFCCVFLRVGRGSQMKQKNMVELDPRVTALAKPRINCTSKLQTHPLVSTLRAESREVLILEQVCKYSLIAVLKGWWLSLGLYSATGSAPTNNWPTTEDVTLQDNELSALKPAERETAA
jgi:hypothetical protein